jgi:hypothetical protein
MVVAKWGESERALYPDGKKEKRDGWATQCAVMRNAEHLPTATLSELIDRALLSALSISSAFQQHNSEFQLALSVIMHRVHLSYPSVMYCSQNRTSAAQSSALRAIG